MFIRSNQPYQQKRNFKYSHLLAGKTYNNQKFISSCSYLDHDIKISTTASQISSDTPEINGNHPRESRAKVYSMREVHSATDKKLYLEASIDLAKAKRSDNRACTAGRRKPDIYGCTPQSTPFKRTSLVQTAYSNKSAFKNVRTHNFSRRTTVTPQNQLFIFPSVEIRIIDKINHLSEVQQKSIHMSFESVFKRMVSPQIMGNFTLAFLQKIEQYTKQIISNNYQFQLPLEQSLRTISKKEDLLQRIYQLELQGQQLKVHQLISYYCLPKPQACKKLFKSLIDQLTIQIYQKKNCNKNIEYVLMNEQGEQITHISHIYFSTKVLLIAAKETREKAHLNYCKVKEQHHKSTGMTLKESIRSQFFNKVKGDQFTVNYHPQSAIINAYRRQAVQKAEQLLKNKSKLKFLSKKIIEQNGFYKARKSIDENDSINFLSTRYEIRRKRQKIQYKAIILRLQQILDPNRGLNVKTGLDERTQQQFRRLYNFNDSFDITYNYCPSNTNKLVFANFMANGIHFKNKNNKQLYRINKCLQRLYSEGKPIQQISFWQFKQIYQTALGAANQNVIIKVILQYLNFDQFGQISKLQFYDLLADAIAQQGRPLQVIQDILWNWLQNQNLIQNNALRSHHLQIWYEPVRIAFLLLASIIFGDQYANIIQMLQALISQDYN